MSVNWICTGWWDGHRTERHAGVAPTLPTRCPHCGQSVKVRTHCACGYPIDDCSQSICRHPFASAD